MGKAFYDAFPSAKEVFQQADDALNQKLSTLMFEGDEEELTSTVNAQPAILTCSEAILNVLSKEANVKIASAVDYVAGHSLGEYTALAAVGSFTLEQAVKLVRFRAEAMQEAVPQGQGAMLAIIGLSFEEVEAVCREASAGGVCEIANYNTDSQIVISGAAMAIGRAVDIATAKGAKKVVPLPVSAPFHCSMMEPAAMKMFGALDSYPVQPLLKPLIANLSARPETDPAEIKTLLTQQVMKMVRWKESIDTMVELGVTRFVEIGHGKVLTGLVKRITKEAECINISSPDDIDAFAKVA